MHFLITWHFVIFYHASTLKVIEYKYGRIQLYRIVSEHNSNKKRKVGQTLYTSCHVYSQTTTTDIGNIW